MGIFLHSTQVWGIWWSSGRRNQMPRLPRWWVSVLCCVKEQQPPSTSGTSLQENWDMASSDS